MVNLTTYKLVYETCIRSMIYNLLTCGNIFYTELSVCYIIMQTDDNNRNRKFWVMKKHLLT